jgi:hypothetical protein
MTALHDTLLHGPFLVSTSQDKREGPCLFDATMRAAQLPHPKHRRSAEHTHHVLSKTIGRAASRE